jgi:primosomal protein N' (replication factor Y)
MANQATSSSTYGPGARIAVLLPLPLSGCYDYRVSDGTTLAPGDVVEVPLGRRRAIGVVWGPGSDAVPESKLRKVVDRLPVPAVGEDNRRFIDWVAAYTVTPPGAVLKMMFGATAGLYPPAPRTAYQIAGAPPERMTDARRRVMAMLDDGPPRTLSELCAEGGVSSSVVHGLVGTGTLVPVLLGHDTPFEEPDPDHVRPALAPAQATAAGVLVEAVAHGGFSTVLVDGVPGAGKTEVYFEAVAEALARGRQVLVLLPEIALTGRWLDRFDARFGVQPAQWHSELPIAVRRRTWRAVAEGAARVVVGARSALFLPFRNLGLVVVDEEHDTSYKQEDGVIYNARDMAVARAHLGEFPAVLASATPSLETVVNVDGGRYLRVHLPHRHGAAELAPVTAIDMRQVGLPSTRWLAPDLVREVADTIARSEQVLLFLNRRGYAPLTLCRHCGFRFECPNCSTWLVSHRRFARLMCHHCGYAVAEPDACPACEAPGELAACGPGVERLADEITAALPEARVTVVASDTLAGPRAAAALFDRIDAHEVDVLIGTQVLAKGHHFPLLTLVGVVDADLGLDGGDLRAAERTYQLLYQVAGRAGRADRPGRVVLQTYVPDHPVMAALVSGDREAFLDREKDARRRAGMPPFGRLVALIVSGPDEAAVVATARELARTAPRHEEVRVYGPAPAPFALLRGRVRHRLLLKASRRVAVQDLVRRWVDAVSRPAAVRIQVDVDPYSFL